MSPTTYHCLRRKNTTPNNGHKHRVGRTYRTQDQTIKREPNARSKKRKRQKETEKKQRTDETMVKKKTQNMNRWHFPYAPSVKNEKSNMCHSRLHTCRPREHLLSLCATPTIVFPHTVFFFAPLYSRTIPILRSCTSVRASLPRASLPLLLVYLQSPRSARHLTARVSHTDRCK